MTETNPQIQIDTKRGKELAKFLYDIYFIKGAFKKFAVPEDTNLIDAKIGSLEHILYLTLTVSIDYQRDAPSLWVSAANTFNDSETRYLFDPISLHLTRPHKIARDMQKYKLSKKPKKDSYIWRTVGVTFYKKWCGDPRNFLKNYNWNSTEILNHLRNDTHLYNGKSVSDYPFLRGNKIAPLWLRLLRDGACLAELKNMDEVPIPVDIHIARATLTTGVVTGKIKNSKIDKLFEDIRYAWRESVKGLRFKNRPMIALDMDRPLWLLSKFGCTNRDKITGDCPCFNECDVRDFCIKGTVNIENNVVVELNT